MDNFFYRNERNAKAKFDALVKEYGLNVKNGKVNVTVGSIEHPMGVDHYIEWISLQTTKGNQRKFLKPGDKPQICFAICDDEVVEAVFAYCNLHSLWKA